ncbi:MAG: hypothetical protein N4A59_11335 [Marinifilum sp.]|jgi:hypothetical protein|nr:hypothetical protein [Marinifilum sp.]
MGELSNHRFTIPLITGGFPNREPERSGAREYINMKIVCEQTVDRQKGGVNYNNLIKLEFNRYQRKIPNLLSPGFSSNHYLLT